MAASSDPEIATSDSDRRRAIVFGLAGSTLAAAGIGVSAYLTVAHYRGAKVLLCSEHGAINCAKVTTSSYAVQHGVPLVLLGLGFFTVSLLLQLPPLWLRDQPAIRVGRAATAAVGAVSALWLIWVELFRLDAICIYCTAVHALAIALSILTAFGTAATAPLDVADDDFEELGAA